MDTLKKILAVTWLEISLEMLVRLYFLKCKVHVRVLSQQGQTPALLPFQMLGLWESPPVRYISDVLRVFVAPSFSSDSKSKKGFFRVGKLFQSSFHSVLWSLSSFQ